LERKKKDGRTLFLRILLLVDEVAASGGAGDYSFTIQMQRMVMRTMLMNAITAWKRKDITAGMTKNAENSIQRNRIPEKTIPPIARTNIFFLSTIGCFLKKPVNLSGYRY